MEPAVKVYVPVLAAFASDGKVIPRRNRWEDGEVYEIEKVLDCPCAALKAGGQGDRYTVQIGGKQSYLFFERTVN